MNLSFPAGIRQLTVQVHWQKYLTILNSEGYNEALLKGLNWYKGVARGLPSSRFQLWKGAGSVQLSLDTFSIYWNWIPRGTAHVSFFMVWKISSGHRLTKNSSSADKKCGPSAGIRVQSGCSECSTYTLYTNREDSSPKQLGGSRVLFIL